MTTETLLGPGKAKLSVGARLGKGGEGEVFALANQADLAVKLYASKLAQSRKAKIQAMIEAGLAKATTLVAYPREIVTNTKGDFLGFIMAKVSEHKPIHELYAPGPRKAEFPKADYRFLVHTAANAARAVAAVHRSGCVIGDINHSGMLVSDKATVALIDADSFQLINGSARFLCRVGVPEYTPPELQGQPLDQVERTAEHDAFGLAVMIFQLLWMGRHPFSGRFSGGDMPIERAIREHRFVYSRSRNVGMAPPPATPTLNDFPPEISAAFERAFLGSGQRPAAETWVNMLDRLEASLKRCTNPLHHYPAVASACPWCRMEQSLGVQLFVPTHFVSAANDSGATADLNQLWAAIETIRIPPRLPVMPTFAAPGAGPSEIAMAAKAARLTRKGLAIVVGATGFGLAIYGGGVWPIVWLGLGALALYLWFSVDKSEAGVVSQAQATLASFDTALKQWFKLCSTDAVEDLRDDLAAAKREVADLPFQQDRALEAYKQNRRAEQLKAYLERFLIRSASIKGVGPSKIAALTSYGIEDAADVTPYRVQAVPGFGPVLTQSVVAWRQRLEARFVYDPNTNQVDRARIVQIKAEHAAKRTPLVQKLAQGPAALRSAIAHLNQLRASPHPQLQTLYAARCQAEADLKALGRPAPAISIPKLEARPPRVVSAPARPSGATLQPAQGSPPRMNTGIATCPRCGSGMKLRVARRGYRAGRKFWGCSNYPSCTGTRPY